MITGAFYVDGKVALRYFQPVPKYVSVAGKQYIFDVRHAISLIFVPEEEVLALFGSSGWLLWSKTPSNKFSYQCPIFSLVGRTRWKINILNFMV